MTPFQIVFLVLDGALVVVSPAAVRFGWLTLRAWLVCVLVGAVGAVAVLWPGLTTKAAHLVGIHRGADLLLYCSVMVMLIGFLMTYAKLRALRREFTLLVRHVAIQEGEERQAGSEATTQQVG